METTKTEIEIKFSPVLESDTLEQRRQKRVINEGIRKYEKALNAGESHEYAEECRNTYIANNYNS